MATTDLSSYNAEQVPDASEMTFGVVVSDWNHEITHTLLKGSLETLKSNGAADENIHVVHVPGSYELPTGAMAVAKGRKVDAVICLGCVIKGETRHDEYINQAVATGLINLSVVMGKPFIFGVLTTENEAQAKDRAGGKHGNKGTEAAVSAIRMIALQKEMSTPTRDKFLGFR